MKHNSYGLIVFLINIVVHLDGSQVNRTLYVEGFRENGTSEHVAVMGVPYRICRDDQEEISCNFNNASGWIVSKESGLSQWVMFAKEPNHQELSYEIVPCESGTPLKKNNAISFFLKVLDNGSRIQILDKNENYLSYDRRSENVLLDSDDTKDRTTWVLKSVYDIRLALGTNSLENKLNLKTLSGKVLDTKIRLSQDQLQCLYALHESGVLSFHESTDDDIFVVTLPDSLYEEGVLISAAGSTVISVFHLQNYAIGIADNQGDAQRTVQKKSTKDPVKIKPGKTLYIKALPPLPAKTSSLGKIEIRVEEDAVATGVTDSSITLEEVFKEPSHLSHLRAGFVIKVEKNHITANYSDKNSVLNPGTAAHVAQAALAHTADNFGKEGNKMANRLAEGVERLGSSIEKSSITIREALISSSANLNQGMLLSAYKLGNSLCYASETFELSVNTLSKALKMSTRDVREAVQSLSWDISNASTTLAKSLKGSSEILGDSLVKASTAFNDAFKELSNALENSSDTMSSSLDRASNKFVEGMSYIDAAAKRLSTIKVSHSASFSQTLRLK